MAYLELLSAGLLRKKLSSLIIRRSATHTRFNGGFAVLVVLYGDLHWFPRDDKLQTPPGLEGSNGSSGFGCRGVAGVGHLHNYYFQPYLYLVKTKK